jgi:hypothetical protein
MVTDISNDRISLECRRVSVGMSGLALHHQASKLLSNNRKESKNGVPGSQ